MGVGVLFLDMNSYFASVEQQYRPECRGKPVVVAAVKVDSTCCIAASIEAKRYGIRTGTPVREARRRCRGLRILEARPELYFHVHQEIRKAVEEHLPVTRVDSIDEFWCRLMGTEREPERARGLALAIKRSIAARVGRYLRCSIGLAPNRVLAKVAAEMQKPDGLTAIRDEDLPGALYGLALDDLPGIGPRMLRRLHRHQVFTVEQLCGLSEASLRRVWQGVVGSYWWHWLRGDDPYERPTRRQSMGHSHVLPPELRSEEGAHAVLIRLIHKVAARLRRARCWASRLDVYLSYTYAEEGWTATLNLGLCQDTLTMVEAFEGLWPHRPKNGPPTQVAATLWGLTPEGSAPLPLFPEAQRRTELARVMDRINARVGPQAIYLASTHDVRQAAPTRIAFSRVPDFGRACAYTLQPRIPWAASQRREAT